MITDLLDNGFLYFPVSERIKAGLMFLQQVQADIELGEYAVSDGVKAIVSSYMTKSVFEPGYEAHKRVIDIQYPIIGLERVKWSPLKNMAVKTAYDSINDCGYYEQPSQNTYVDIGNGVFAIMFPNDAHYPQLFVNEPELIKKITIKISI